ncbi:hypothetical protein HNR76_000421 [Pseudoxanthomonas broegbernensis]|nr:hypothetical protein [Pseudoxanthomonas broegbernensis]
MWSCCEAGNGTGQGGRGIGNGDEGGRPLRSTVPHFPLPGRKARR